VAALALMFVVALGRGMPEPEVRALAFFSLVLTIVGLILVNRSFSTSLLTALRRPNPGPGPAGRHRHAEPDPAVAVRP